MEKQYRGAQFNISKVDTIKISNNKMIKNIEGHGGSTFDKTIHKLKVE
jgi:hypothetical protein